MFATLTLLSRISSPREIREFFERLPQFFPGKMKIHCPNDLKEAAIEKVKKKAPALRPKEMSFLDGIRLDFDDSWMLIRASGTEPAIRIMTESIRKIEGDTLLSEGVKLVEEILATDP